MRAAVRAARGPGLVGGRRQPRPTGRTAHALRAWRPAGGSAGGSGGAPPNRGGGGRGEGESDAGGWGARGLLAATVSAFLASSLASGGLASAQQVDQGSTPSQGVVLESWLSWLDKLVNDCIDGKGNLDLAELEARLASATRGGQDLSRKADQLWRAIDEGDVGAAESIIESVDKDRMLNFGKHAVRSICAKDEALVDGAARAGEVWKLVQLSHFGSAHQQALARSRLEALGSDKGARTQASEAEADVRTINSVLLPYQGGDVKRLSRLLGSGKGEQRVMAAQALSGLCGMGLSERVAEALGRSPALVKELVSLLESEVGRGAEKAGGAAAASPRSPLLSEWMEDFSLPPKVSLAGLLGALGTHRPDALHRAVDLGVLRPLSGMLDQGNPRERELVSSLLLVMMTASERAWTAAKSSEGLFSTGTPLLSRCLEFQGTHGELGDYMLAASR